MERDRIIWEDGMARLFVMVACVCLTAGAGAAQEIFGDGF
jgi:hypothetical protein